MVDQGGDDVRLVEGRHEDRVGREIVLEVRQRVLVGDVEGPRDPQATAEEQDPIDDGHGVGDGGDGHEHDGGRHGGEDQAEDDGGSQEAQHHDLAPRGGPRGVELRVQLVEPVQGELLGDEIGFELVSHRQPPCDVRALVRTSLATRCASALTDEAGVIR